MSVVSESPLNSSSSSGDFATLLEEELEVSSSSSLLEEEAGSRKDGDDGNTNDLERRKRRKIHEDEDDGLSHLTTSSNFTRSCNRNVQRNEVLPEAGMCPPHPGYFRGLCIRCAKQMDEGEGSGVALGYIHKDLKLNHTEIDRVRETDLKKLLGQKKLILVLDLDHTLLNSTRLIDLRPEEEYLLHDINTLQEDSNRSLFRLDSMHMLTKLRPFVHSFLSELSSLYEMYIYTMAERSYAMEIAKLLDPAGVYFHSKVISQSDCTQRHQKGLDVVLGAESTVLILDDTEVVWQKHRENLILMERYHYFAESCRLFHFNQVSLSIAKKDECEKDGVLPSILNVLKRVHELFFDPGLGSDFSARDVRPMLRKARQEVFQGCRVVFSRLFSSSSRAEDQPIWKRCEQLGATCLSEVDSSVTHVVSRDRWTDKAKWATHNEKFLVSPGWVEAAFYLWKRMPEADFPVK